MYTLSLWQPWASAMALELKKIETRGRYFSLRGPLAIHATAKIPRQVWRWLEEAEQHSFLKSEPRSESLREGMKILLALGTAGVEDWRTLPLGCVLCTVDVVDCRPTTTWKHVTGIVESGDLTDLERAFGDYSPGRFGLITTNLRRLPEPVPAKGKQGLWTWNES